MSLESEKSRFMAAMDTKKTQQLDSQVDEEKLSAVTHPWVEGETSWNDIDLEKLKEAFGGDNERAFTLREVMRLTEDRWGATSVQNKSGEGHIDLAPTIRSNHVRRQVESGGNKAIFDDPYFERINYGFDDATHFEWRPDDYAKQIAGKKQNFEKIPAVAPANLPKESPEYTQTVNKHLADYFKGAAMRLMGEGDPTAHKVIAMMKEVESLSGDAPEKVLSDLQEWIVTYRSNVSDQVRGWLDEFMSREDDGFGVVWSEDEKKFVSKPIEQVEVS